MKLRIAVITTCLLLAFWVTDSSAQVCGDASNDGVVNIQDLISLFEYTSGNLVSPFSPADADCDGITGITVGDTKAVSDYIFGMGSLNCSVTGSYGFASAPDDTIFIPNLAGITDGIDTLDLLIYAHFSSPIGGYYLPVRHTGSSPDGIFSLSLVRLLDINVSVAINPGGDTTVLTGIDMQSTNDLDGQFNLAMLNYTRNSPGTGDITPEAFDRAGDWRIAIERGGDLYLPVIQYYDPGSLSGVQLTPSTHDLVFSTVVDSAVTDTTSVDFTHSGAPIGVEFELVRSDSWILLTDFTGVGPLPTYNSPASVPISADASGLGVYDYEGWLHVNISGFSSYSPVDSIKVTLSVQNQPNTNYPPGDLNCDSQVDVADLTLLVLYLFLGGPAPLECP